MMNEELRWLVAYLHVMGWPALLVLATFFFERLVFLRGQPQRRPVLGWYFSVWFIARDLVGLLTTHAQGQDPYEWPAGPGYARALYMLLWITALAAIECVAVQGRAVWQRRSGFFNVRATVEPSPSVER